MGNSHADRRSSSGRGAIAASRLSPTIALGDGDERGHVFLLLGATNGFRNDGFTDSPANGSTVQVTGPLWIVGAGYGISLDALRLSGMAYKPLTGAESPVDYGIGFQVTVGVNLELWSNDDVVAEAHGAR